MSPEISKNGFKKRTVNNDTIAMLEIARREGIETVWDRLEKQQPQCGFCSQHCESFIRSFERLLRSAAACDPNGMIVDALHGNTQGRLYQVMCELRDAPPPARQD